MTGRQKPIEDGKAVRNAIRVILAKDADAATIYHALTCSARQKVLKALDNAGLETLTDEFEPALRAALQNKLSRQAFAGQASP